MLHCKSTWVSSFVNHKVSMVILQDQSDNGITKMMKHKSELHFGQDSLWISARNVLTVKIGPIFTRSLE